MFSQSMSRIYYFHITPNFTFLLGKAEFLNCPLILYRRLRPHEAHLSTVALSNVESSRTIGQILHDMNDMKDLKWIKDTPTECVLPNLKSLVTTSNLSVETQEEVHGWHPSIIYPLPILFFYSLWRHQKFVLAYETHERDISQLCIECELCILLGWSLMFKALSVHSWYEIE